MGLIATFGATGFLVTALLAWLLVMVVAARSFEPPAIRDKLAKEPCPLCRKTRQGTLVMRRPLQLRPVHTQLRAAGSRGASALLEAGA